MFKARIKAMSQTTKMFVIVVNLFRNVEAFVTLDWITDEITFQKKILRGKKSRKIKVKMAPQEHLMPRKHYKRHSRKCGRNQIAWDWQTHKRQF